MGSDWKALLPSTNQNTDQQWQPILLDQFDWMDGGSVAPVPEKLIRASGVILVLTVNIPNAAIAVQSGLDTVASHSRRATVLTRYRMWHRPI